MSDTEKPSSARQPLSLVPRMKDQGYGERDVAKRRRWTEEKTGSQLKHVGGASLATESLRGNIENPIGTCQVPLGLAGPLRIKGQACDDTVYVPLATTEGALVRSYERGMVVLTRSGGVTARIDLDENRVAPIFRLADVAAAQNFMLALQASFEEIRDCAESTTAHGRLLRVDCLPVGRSVIASFCYSTGDAQGMNLITRATEAACAWISRELGVSDYSLYSGYGSEKRATGSLLLGGKGKRVTAGALIPRRLLRLMLRVEPEDLVELWRSTSLGHLQANAVGYNGHAANGLTALFIACGQDVANVVNAAVSLTCFEATKDGDLYLSTTLPSLTVATVGGGTDLGTARECLEVLGCHGDGKCRRFAEIVAATVLAGELSFGAAIASGEQVAAHESYGRNRPVKPAASSAVNRADHDR